MCVSESVVCVCVVVVVVVVVVAVAAAAAACLFARFLLFLVIKRMVALNLLHTVLKRVNIHNTKKEQTCAHLQREWQYYHDVSTDLSDAHLQREWHVSTDRSDAQFTRRYAAAHTAHGLRKRRAHVDSNLRPSACHAGWDINLFKSDINHSLCRSATRAAPPEGNPHKL